MTDIPYSISAPSAEAVQSILAEYGDRTEPLNLCVVPDEEVFAYGDGAEDGPYGTWFAALPDEMKQMSATGALRALAAHGEIDTGTTPEGAGAVELPTQTVAALALRRLEPQLSWRVIGGDGETWYVLRFVSAGIFLREVVTQHGFHLLSLVRLDDEERDGFIGRVEWPAGAESVPAPEIDVRVTEAQLEAASLELTTALDFLDTTRYVGNLVRVPSLDGVVTSMVNVRDDGSVVIGDVVDGGIHYRGATIADLRADWARWVAKIEATEEPGVGLEAHPELLSEPLSPDDPGDGPDDAG